MAANAFAVRDFLPEAAQHTNSKTGGVYEKMNLLIQFGVSVMPAILALTFTCVTFPPSSFAQEIPAKSLQEDFRIARSALEQAHGGIYRYVSRPEIELDTPTIAAAVPTKTDWRWNSFSATNICKSSPTSD